MDIPKFTLALAGTIHRSAASFSRPQSSSASRLTAGAAGFLLLIQCGERPEIQGEPSRFASEGIMSRSLRRPSARTDLDHLPIKDHMHSLTLLPWPLLNVLQQVCTNLLVVLTTQASLQCAYPSLRGAKQNCGEDAVHKTRNVLRSGVFGRTGKRLSRDERARKTNTLCPHVVSGDGEHCT